MYFVFFCSKNKIQIHQDVFQIQIQITFSKCISNTKYKIQILCILNTYFKYLYLKYYPALPTNVMGNSPSTGHGGQEDHDSRDTAGEEIKDGRPPEFTKLAEPTRDNFKSHENEPSISN